MGYPRTTKDRNEKQLRKIYQAYRETWKWRGYAEEHGEWVKVDPYQNGWTRTYELRDDIKNRQDAPDIRQVLHKLNSVVFCRDKNFLEYQWRHSKKKPLPIKQPLKNLTIEQYEALSEKHKSFFHKAELVETITFPYKRKVFVTRYVFTKDFWFVFKIEPNIIEYHWHPDPAWESHCAEIRNKVDRDNLWPKINKMLGDRSHSPEWREGPWYKNKLGKVMTDDGFEE